MKILVVDDETVSQEKMTMILRTFGECQIASEGQEAIDIFCRAWNEWAPFDLITLDISMTGVGGMEVLKEIRKMERKKNIPLDKRSKVIMVTANSTKEIILTCVNAGCNDYVVKPFSREIIKQKMEKLGLVAKV